LKQNLEVSGSLLPPQAASSGCGRRDGLQCEG